MPAGASSPMAENRSTYIFCTDTPMVLRMRVATQSFSRIMAMRMCSVPTSGALNRTASW